jgi:hypothetical protein
MGCAKVKCHSPLHPRCFADNNIVILTNTVIFDIVADVGPSEEGAFGAYAVLAIPENSGNSERTANALLFFRSLRRRQPRISAEIKILLADNFWKNSENSENRRHHRAESPPLTAIRTEILKNFCLMWAIPQFSATL